VTALRLTVLAAPNEATLAEQISEHLRVATGRAASPSCTLYVPSRRARDMHGTIFAALQMMVGVSAGHFTYSSHMITALLKRVLSR
jgi:hypothetical protein